MSSVRKHRVFLADDHEIVRAGLRHLLDAQLDLVVVGEAADGRAVLKPGALDGVDVLVLDLSLPRVDGSEVLRRVKRQRPELPVVVLSMYPDDPFAKRALEVGAFEYLNKTTPTEMVVEDIRRAASGVRVKRSAGLERPSADTGELHERLTPREFQVFLLLLRGRNVSDIAAELDLSLPTVSTHLGKVREKLGVRTNGDILNYAHRAGLVGPS